VCGDKGVNCSWGQAINVANRYVYVSQPLKDRVLVISKIQMVVVDVSAPILLQHLIPYIIKAYFLFVFVYCDYLKQYLYNVFYIS
jgi:hypothetical protein